MLIQAPSALAQAAGWSDLGGGLAGATDVPRLEAYGSLYPGTVAVLRVKDAAPASSALLSISFVYTSTPFAGGTANTLPPAMVMDAPTDGDGNAVVYIPLPAETPGGLTFYAEAFVPDAGAPQGIAISNTVRGVTLDASAIPDPAAFYYEALSQAWLVGQSGSVPMDLFNTLAATPAFYASNPAAVLDTITPVEVVEDSTDSAAVPQDPVVGGGTVHGGSLVWKSLVGLEVGSAKISVPWTSTACASTLGAPTITGSCFAATYSAALLGAKWTLPCPAKEVCPAGVTRECGNYQITWSVTVLTVVITSGTSQVERICAPCP